MQAPSVHGFGFSLKTKRSTGSRRQHSISHRPKREPTVSRASRKEEGGACKLVADRGYLKEMKNKTTPSHGVWCVAALGLLCSAHISRAEEPSFLKENVGLRVPGPLSQRVASYRMQVRLDEKTHEVSGKSTLFWRNNERKEATELFFNLYQNAFKNRATTFVREAGTQLRGDEMPEHGYGATDVSSLKIGGVEMVGKAVVVDSLLSLKLDTPIPAGATVEIEFVFATKLPKVFARSGYAGDFHAVGQWFPKIAVFECDKDAVKCGFRAHQYHGHTEFFSEHGNYDVTVDVPARFVVGATGVQVGEQSDGTRKTITFRADDVRDFAWFADPRFVETKATVSDSLGEVTVRLLNQPGLASQTSRHIESVRAAILEGEQRYFPYPYKQVTVIMPPHDAGGAGGMEYPQLITSWLTPFPNGMHWLEATDAHEFGHQWIPLMIGSDEVEDAWLDEGLTQTFTAWAVDRMYPSGCTTLEWGGFCIGDRDLDFLATRGVVRRMPLASMSRKLDGRTYSSMTYGYTSLMMRSLENHLGDEKMHKAMRTFAQKYRFQKPRPTDFMNAISEGAGEDLTWFWQQAVYSTRVADYEVAEIQNQKHELAYGLWDCPPKPAVLPGHTTEAEREPWLRDIQEANQAACVGKPAGRHELAQPEKTAKKTDAELAKDYKNWDSVVFLRRRGEFLYPVDVTVKFGDGSQEKHTWTYAEQVAHPEERLKILYFYRRAPVKQAEIDPEFKLALDEKRLNNGLLTKPNLRPVNRLALTFQGFFQTLLDLLTL